MRAQLLIIKLPYKAEALQRELEVLVTVLPSGTRRVIGLDQTVGFLVPYTVIADVQAVRWRSALRPFSDWWIIGINGELACKNKSHDPFRTWMDEFRRSGAIAEGGKTENVPFPETGTPRFDPSINDLIERTFGKMGLKPTSDKNRTQ